MFAFRSVTELLLLYALCLGARPPGVLFEGTIGDLFVAPYQNKTFMDLCKNIFFCFLLKRAKLHPSP